jgi:hypothetical protein
MQMRMWIGPRGRSVAPLFSSPLGKCSAGPLRSRPVRFKSSTERAFCHAGRLPWRALDPSPPANQPIVWANPHTLGRLGLQPCRPEEGSPALL